MSSNYFEEHVLDIKDEPLISWEEMLDVDGKDLQTTQENICERTPSNETSPQNLLTICCKHEFIILNNSKLSIYQIHLPNNKVLILQARQYVCKICNCNIITDKLLSNIKVIPIVSAQNETKIYSVSQNVSVNSSTINSVTEQLIPEIESEINLNLCGSSKSNVNSNRTLKIKRTPNILCRNAIRNIEKDHLSVEQSSASTNLIIKNSPNNGSSNYEQISANNSNLIKNNMLIKKYNSSVKKLVTIAAKETSNTTVAPINITIKKRGRGRQKSTVKKIYECTICSRILSCGKNLKNHITSKHFPPEEKPHQCEICLRSYATRPKLRKHSCRPIVNKKTQLYQCPKCEKQFKNKPSLKEHISTIHDKTFRFICNFCNKGYNVKYALKIHVQSMHLNIKPNICHICGKTFGTASRCNTHIKSHDSTYNVKCHLCGFTYKNKYTLKKHLQSHKNIKKFQCDLCKNYYANRNCLASHIRFHLNIRPFKCKQCNKAYASKNSYNYHIKTVHGGYTRADLRRPVTVAAPSKRPLIN